MQLVDSVGGQWGYKLGWQARRRLEERERTANGQALRRWRSVKKLFGWDCCFLLLLWRRVRKITATWRKYAQLCVVQRRVDTELHCAFNL